MQELKSGGPDTMKMNVYNCMNPKENPMPSWITEKNGGPNRKPEPDFKAIERERVRMFKECPDSFFPEFCKKHK